jgi:IS30 family transposase
MFHATIASQQKSFKKLEKEKSNMEQKNSISKDGKGKHLTLDDRLIMEGSLKAGQKPSWIALILNCDRSTVYREKNRGTFPHTNSDLTTSMVYNGRRAQEIYESKKETKGPGLKIGCDMKLHNFIRNKILYEHYAPDVIAGVLKKDNAYSVTLSTKTIYNYIESGYIRGVNNYTLKEKTQRKKRGKGKKRAKKVEYKQKKSIRKRPSEADDRKEIGHLEGDLIVSGTGMSTAALLTIVDRKSRYAFILKIPDKTQKSVIDGLSKMERRIGAKRFRELFKTLTLDNGSEFLDWESLERSSITKTIKRIVVYFADPFSSWQRGTNENFNGMVRKFIPKGADIGKYTNKEIRQIEEWINNYPRRILDYTSAKNVFERELRGCQA